MIEITAQLCRGPVYFTSEDVKCFVTLRNVVHDDDENVEAKSSGPGQGHGSGSGTEMLAWAGAQIYCHCSLDESRVQFVPSERRESGNAAIASRGTSFDPSKSEAGYVVFATTPKILFCGLSLEPNESRTFTYEEKIPLHVPPSYYGSAVKYLYKLTIGTQRVKSGIQLLRIPLRILSPDYPDHRTDGSIESLDRQSIASSSSAPAVVGPVGTLTNGSMNSTDPQSGSEELSEEEKMELLIHRLECLTARKSPSSFLITNASGQVARFHLLKSSFKLGEDVIGIFNFSEAVVPCVQFSVTLQSEELISDACRSSSSSRSSSAQQANISNHSRHHDFCLHTEQTQIMLPIPLTVTPAFQTNIVSLSWRLHFEFVTTKADNLKPEILSDSQGFMSRAAARLPVQTMVWDLPLKIYPNHPLQVARGLQLPASSTILV